MLLEQLEADRYRALYRLGLEEQPAARSPSGALLHLLSDTFFKKLTDLPDLELSRENAAPVLHQEDQDALLRVPEQIFFHLVENRDADFPFAFLATYATMDAGARSWPKCRAAGKRPTR